MMQRIVLAYSGGLDTSVAVRWLADRGYEVIALAVDVGQGGSCAALRRRAKAAGASRVVITDLKRPFLEQFAFRALRAGAVYEGKYTLGTALARPLIAQALVEAARKLGADAVAHGSTGKGNDQVRFEVAVRALNPRLGVVAPVREWELTSRASEIMYAKAHGITVPVTTSSPYSIDANLWGTSIECGALEDPRDEPPDDTYLTVRPVGKTPARPAYVEIAFQGGLPVRLNGRKLSAVALVSRLNALGGAHGIGRTDLVENRLVGIKSREVYEAPAATILAEAHSELERLVLDRELYHAKQRLALQYAEQVYYGLWFTPLREALDAFVDVTQRCVTGSVRVKLHHGQAVAVGRSSRHTLYQPALATYGDQDAFEQRHGEGFVKLWGLPYEGRGKKCA